MNKLRICIQRTWRLYSLPFIQPINIGLGFVLIFAFLFYNRQLRSLPFHHEWLLRLSFFNDLFNSCYLLFLNFYRVLLSSGIYFIVIGSWISRCWFALTFFELEFIWRENVIFNNLFLSLLHKWTHSFYEAFMPMILHHFFHRLVICNRIKSVIKILLFELFSEIKTEFPLLFQLLRNFRLINLIIWCFHHTLLINIFIIYRFHELLWSVLSSSWFGYL